MLKEQVNYEDHVPGCVRQQQQNASGPGGPWPRPLDTESDGQEVNRCVQEPIFVSMKTETWLCISVPLAIYATDLAVRKWRRRKAVTISQVVQHGKVMQIAIQRSFSRCQPGQVQAAGL